MVMVVALAGLAMLLSACSGGASSAPIALPTAVSGAASEAQTCVPTAPNAEGPFYTPGSPAKTDFLAEATSGVPIRLRGQVLNSACQPLPGITVDFWQTDGNGAYDNEGYRLRGRQVTDEMGAYALDTVLPGLYPGRPAHIHVKLFSEDGRELLTTQMYFPGEGADGLFDPTLVARVGTATAGELLPVVFDFVLSP